MIFATGGYQSGALQYAKRRGIAAIIFVEGRFIYETRGATSQPHALPPGFPEYAGIFVHYAGEQITAKTFARDNVKVLTEWLDDAADASPDAKRSVPAEIGNQARSVIARFHDIDSMMVAAHLPG
jgi:hypothetical protein